MLCFLRDDAAQNLFTVDALELSIGGRDAEVPALLVETPGGNKVRVVGKVDRVDTLQKDGHTYLRIIDYKTGNKKFDLADVYHGLNMQMLVYMAALEQGGGARYPNALPAAVLYLRSDPTPETAGREEKTPPLFSFDGLILNEPAILRAMDSEGTGIFLPVTYKNDGTPKAGNKRLASLAKLGLIRAHVEDMLAHMADDVYAGRFGAYPLAKDKERPCGYCDYRIICRHRDGQDERPREAPKDIFTPAEEVAP